MFIFFGILPRIHKSHAAEPNGSADPRLGTPAVEHDFIYFFLFKQIFYLFHLPYLIILSKSQKVRIFIIRKYCPKNNCQKVKNLGF
jgi:hypothetical protein